MRPELRAAASVFVLLSACTGSDDDSTPADEPEPPWVAAPACPDGGGFDGFVTREGDRLYDGAYPYRFVSFNVPNLHIIEDPDWHLPDPWEQRDAVQSVDQMGGTVIRIYTLSVGSSGSDTPRHVTAPGEFSEDLFVALDHAVAEARERCIRLIIPLVDQHHYWGGIEEYAAFRGLEKEDFWTDDELFEDYMTTVEFLLTRTNTVTGVQYRDDPTILAWETGNELDIDSPSAWTIEAASRIKELDPNHLVLDGRYGVDPSVLDAEEIDMVSNHYYKWDPDDSNYWTDIQEDFALTEDKRPFLVGEFGFVSPSEMEGMLDNLIENRGIVGALIWSLRSHDVDGGFYWHRENAPDYYDPDGFVRSYHWPGFDSGEDWDETEILSLMRDKAFEIRGWDIPPILAPEPPTILTSTESAEFSWQGSVGAAAYSLERSETEEGPWEVVASGFHDAEEANTALVSDPSFSADQSWYYQMRAHNSGGDSEVSNVVGPIPETTDEERTFTDELDNLDLVESASDGLYIEDSDDENFSGDLARVSRINPSVESLVYALDDLQWMSVEAYYWPDQAFVDLLFEVSANGTDYEALEVIGEDKGGDWTHWVYSADAIPEGTNHLKITIQDTSGKSWTPQLSRVELGYIE